MADYKIARQYAQHGFPVLMVWGIDGKACHCPLGKRCETPGKHPIHGAWQKRATTNTKKIRRWCEEYPDEHLGIMPMEDTCIIDVDPRNGGLETLEGLKNGDRFRTTVTQESGGGGYHLFYKGQPSGPLGKGIDVKKPGRGFVVAAPAGHVSGGSYTWRVAPWDLPLRKLPRFLRGRQREDDFDAAASEFDKKPVKKLPIETIREALTHIEADDYARWINIGHALKHSYGDDGEEIWLEWSKTSEKYEDGDEDKWSTLDHNRDRPLVTIRSIMSLARRGGYRPLAKEFDETLWSLANDPVASYTSDTPIPIEWVFEPCIPRGKVVVIAGAGGSSKSYFALTLGISLATEQKLGELKPGDPGKVLMLVAEENRDDIHRRMHNIVEHCGHTGDQIRQINRRVGILSVRGLDWRMVEHNEAGDVIESDRVDYLIDEIRNAGNVKMVILDPLISFSGASENDNMEMARLMFTLDRIAEKTNAAVVVIHHARKAGTAATLDEMTQGDVRGASSIVDNARGVILITKMPLKEADLFNIKKEEAGRFILARVVKNNYGPYVKDVVFSIEKGGALRYAPEIQKSHQSVKAAEKAMEEKDGEAAILHALRKGPLTRSQIEEKTHKSRAAVTRYLRDMDEGGYVERSGFGKSSFYVLTSEGKRKLKRSIPTNGTDMEGLL